MQYLGYIFYVKNDKCRLEIHTKTNAKLRSTLKELTGRSNGMGYEQRKELMNAIVVDCVCVYGNVG